MVEESILVSENLKTIRKYLIKEFPSFVMTEDTSDTSILHKFTMTNPKTHEQFKLKVGWPRLSHKSSNPEKLGRSLVHGDVARKMRQLKGSTSIGDAAIKGGEMWKRPGGRLKIDR